MFKLRLNNLICLTTYLRSFLFFLSLSPSNVIPTLYSASVRTNFHRSFHHLHIHNRFRKGRFCYHLLRVTLRKQLTTSVGVIVSCFVGNLFNKRCIPLTFSKRSYSTIRFRKRHHTKGVRLGIQRITLGSAKKTNNGQFDLLTTTHQSGFRSTYNRRTNLYPICHCLMFEAYVLLNTL